LLEGLDSGEQILPTATPQERPRHGKSPAKTARLSDRICCPNFRATGTTVYLKAGGTIEKAQQIAAHESQKRQNFTAAPPIKPRLAKLNTLSSNRLAKTALIISANPLADHARLHGVAPRKFQDSSL
jgi:hypothetical protein